MYQFDSRRVARPVPNNPQGRNAITKTNAQISLIVISDIRPPYGKQCTTRRQTLEKWE